MHGRRETTTPCVITQCGDGIVESGENGDFDADGHRDVAVAEQGSSAVDVCHGDRTGARRSRSCFHRGITA